MSHSRVDVIERRVMNDRRGERRARGSVAGSVLVGSQFSPRRRRSVAVVRHLSHYTIADGEVSQTTLFGPGMGAFGSTLGFMTTGGADRG